MFARTNRAVWAFLPTASSAPAKFNHLSHSSWSVSASGLPSFASWFRIILNPVPAISHFIPLSANTHNNAVVSLIDTHAAFAIGQTYFIEYEKFSNPRADLLKAPVKRSVTYHAWLASSWYCLITDQTVVAVFVTSSPVAIAKFVIASVELFISVAVNHNFASSVCNDAISVAVNFVLAQRPFACLSKSASSSLVAPDIPSNTLSCFPYSLYAFTAEVTAETTPVNQRVSPNDDASSFQALFIPSPSQLNLLCNLLKDSSPVFLKFCNFLCISVSWLCALFVSSFNSANL